jgi:hypothetical protein
MDKKQKKDCLVFLVIILSLIVGICLFEFFKPIREKYHAIDFENDPVLWRANFLVEYKEAITHDENWVKDPETLALRVAGYPNDDNIPPEKIDREKTENGIVIVTILSGRLMDDSIARQEPRVELIQDGEVWQVVWAGWRQQCARDTLGLGWTTSYCS